MSNIEQSGPEAPVCPFLGLSADRQSHFTYPHPGHRCFARDHPATTDVRRQVDYCLSPGYQRCDRYQAGQRGGQHPGRAEAGQGARDVSAAYDASAEAKAGAGTVVHAFRAGDSLAKVATRYGLTAEAIAAANQLDPGDVIEEGTRLVIPLGRSGGSGPGGNPNRRGSS